MMAEPRRRPATVGCFDLRGDLVAVATSHGDAWRLVSRSANLMRWDRLMRYWQVRYGDHPDIEVRVMRVERWSSTE